MKLQVIMFIYIMKLFKFPKLCSLSLKNCHSFLELYNVLNISKSLPVYIFWVFEYAFEKGILFRQAEPLYGVGIYLSEREK